MSDHQLDDPTNKVISVFTTHEQAEAAAVELAAAGADREHIHVYDGKADAERIDASAKWFADTDLRLKRYQRELKEGNTVLEFVAEGSVDREKLESILNKHQARFVVLFGEWVTEQIQ